VFLEVHHVQGHSESVSVKTIPNEQATPACDRCKVFGYENVVIRGPDGRKSHVDRRIILNKQSSPADFQMMRRSNVRLAPSGP